MPRRRTPTPAPQPVSPARWHTIERATGWAYRLKLQPLSDGTLLVHEWHRKRPHWERYRKDQRKTRSIIRAEQLGLEPPPRTLFGP